MTRLLMGMPITVCVPESAGTQVVDEVFAYFGSVDRRFSTYRADSEIEAINRGRLAVAESSAAMREVLALCDRTKAETDGYFDIRRPDGDLDPSGVVKGWAVRNAAAILARAGIADFFVDAGGDIQSAGRNERGEAWSVGIRNPFDEAEIIKVVYPRGRGVATSGSYVRGAHIYDPHAPGRPVADIVSLTVIGPDVLEADRFATAAFAMGAAGIRFIDATADLDGYVVTSDRRALMTEGFEAHCRP